MIKRILVLGATGMLGNTVYGYLEKNPNFIVTPTTRNPLSHATKGIFFDPLIQSVETLPKNFDYMINCIGIITPFIDKNPLVSLKINSVFPLELANFCESNNIRLIHITTDCVYSGNQGKYVETAPQDALDFYGKSKSLGECFTNAMVLRTSIVGPEIRGFVSLFSWAKSQAGKSIDGYQTHLWNGLTTKWYAKVCEKIILQEFYDVGLFHIFSDDDVSKFQLLQYFNEIFKLNLDITKAYPKKVDRTLRTEKSLCSKLEIPTVKEMIIEMSKE
ncbi:sugar nucleotide-binding protein [Anaerotignum sp.]|uniref:sugar nucleotide-binding protein n=1 Tax=Anaerotignum sp. TaxID=2039241 RepID=UPI0033242E25